MLSIKNMEGKQMEGNEERLEIVQQWFEKKKNKTKMALLVKDAVSLFLVGLMTPVKLCMSS